MIRYTICLCFAILCACTGGKDEQQKEIVVDELPIQDSTLDTVTKLVEPNTNIFPIPFDSTIFKTFKDSMASLPLSFIKQALKTYDKVGEEDYYIKRYLFIDSLKQNKAYDNYSWDIGMIMYARSFAIDTLRLDSLQLIVWGLHESTYEACPYGDYQLVFGTIFNKEHISTTFFIGEQSSGGDPPAFGNTTIYGKLNNSYQLTKYELTISGEEYEGKIEADTIRDTTTNQLIIN